MFRIVGADVARRVLRAIIVSMVILSPLAATASAQSAARPTDSTTPLGLEQGAPAGAFELSGFESINAYNGNLNFHLPLLHIGGRGGAQTTMMLALNTKSWRVLHTIHNPGSQNPMDVYAPLQDIWWSKDIGYGPGVMEGRHSGYQLLAPSCAPSQTTNPIYKYTVTQLTFRASDGTEYQFRDQLTGGQPATVTNGIICPQIAQSGIGQAGFSRGTVWVSTSGEAMTFVSDTAISDHAVIIGTAADHEFPSGLLMMRDGTQYRIDSGLVSWIRDRNGNSISFQYDPIFKRVTSITSSLGITVTVEYDYPDSQYGICDRINYRGFGGAQRIVRVFKTALKNALRPDQPQGGQTLAQLFPPSEGMNGATSQTNFTTSVVTRVLLPDGVQSYNLLYNVYAEPARVILPTGGMIDYDMTPGSGTLNQGGCPVAGDITCNPVQIYRRVATRTVYPNGPNTTPEGSTTFAASSVGDSQMTYQTTTTITHYAADGQTVLAKDVHTFSGSPKASLFVTSAGGFYPGWSEGKEIQTDSYDPARGKLEGAASLFVQRTPAPTTWWWMPWVTVVPVDSTGEPPQDPQLASTTTTLADSGEVSSTTYQYDQFSNVTDKYEYDFGGALLRHTNTQYVRSNNGTSYTDPTVGVHLRSLPLQESVFDGPTGLEKARTIYEYDNYNQITSDVFHDLLKNQPNITGLDSSFTTTHYTRGNVTKTTHDLFDTTGHVTGSISGYAQYDIAGNVVKIIDPRSTINAIIATTFDFGDRYGSPNNEARSNTVPPELNSTPPRTTFAFPTLVTDALGHTTYTQYDYYLGKPVNTEDANMLVSSMRYSTFSDGSSPDALDRSTELVVAESDSSLKRRTRFTYNDSTRTITTQSDQTTLDDRALKTETLYDGLGRTFETHSYETAGAYITTKHQFDGLGRVSRTFNPFRTSGDVTYGYTDTVYDGLGRVLSVTTPDNAVLTTTYFGSATTVTDQAGKKRRSVTDGLGRLVRMDEPDSSGNLDNTANPPQPLQPTYYVYDALDDLAKATQGAQSRYFMYDSLKRLIRARNPEQDINTNLSPALTDPVTNNSQWCGMYVYDANSNLSSKTDARNITTNYFYDALNRETSRTYSDSTTPEVDHYYDNQSSLPSGAPSFLPGASIGRLVAVTYGGQTSSTGSYQGYDSLGRPNVSAQKTDAQSYTFPNYSYNLAGEMTSETYPSNRVVQMDYDAAGRLSGVKNQASGLYYAGGAGNDGLNRIQYASHGAISAMKLGNNKWEHSTFNARLQPTQIDLGTSSTDSSALKLDYAYGTTSNNGNVLSQTITIGSTVMSQGYGYDALNRLSSATETFNSAQQWQQNYDYDRFGNRAVRNTSYRPSPRQTPTSSSPSDLSFLFNQANNRITATSEYQYDPAGSGNLTSMPNFFSGADSMTYDAENRQKTYTPAGGGATNYTYDGDGRRVKKVVPGNPATTTVFVYNVSGQLIAEYTSDPVPPAQGGGGTSYLTSDPLGSTRVVTKFDSTVKARYDYLPFGEELTAGVGQRTVAIGYSAADSTRQKFTQKERDNESGLDYFLARYYSSAQGRFTSPDEFTGGPDDLYYFVNDGSSNPTFYADTRNPQSLNKYQYCYNNPLRYTDLDGHDPLLEPGDDKPTTAVKGAVIGAAVGTVVGTGVGVFIGGAGGGVAGTLVAPGPGTLGGAVLGGSGGAAVGAGAGAGIGAVAGGIIGGIIGWITGEDTKQPDTAVPPTVPLHTDVEVKLAPQQQSQPAPPPAPIEKRGRGGKERIRDSGLEHLTLEAIRQAARNRSLPPAERRRYQKEEKARKQRNVDKRK